MTRPANPYQRLLDNALLRDGTNESTLRYWETEVLAKAFEEGVSAGLKAKGEDVERLRRRLRYIELNRSDQTAVRFGLYISDAEIDQLPIMELSDD